MIKEFEAVKQEFIDIFDNIDSIWFPRYYQDVLLPYFKLDNGKEVLLETYKILYTDRYSDFNILHRKPYAFKTEAEEKYGFDYKFSKLHNYTISDFTNPDLNLDLINMHHFFNIFKTQDKFNSFIEWIENRYELLYNIENYNKKKISLKNIRIIFNT
jgi:hypothetical protein